MIAGVLTCAMRHRFGQALTVRGNREQLMKHRLQLLDLERLVQESRVLTHGGLHCRRL